MVDRVRRDRRSVSLADLRLVVPDGNAAFTGDLAAIGRSRGQRAAFVLTGRGPALPGGRRRSAAPRTPRGEVTGQLREALRWRRHGRARDAGMTGQNAVRALDTPWRRA